MMPGYRRFFPTLLAVALLAALWIASRAGAQPSPSQPQREPLIRPAAASLQAGPSLQLIYSETVPAEGESRLWAADPADPAARQLLAVITHQVGYPPEGAVAPGGSQLALLVLPPGTSETAARTNGGELYLLDSNGTLALRAARVGMLGQWSPDGTALVFGRLIPLTDEVPFRTELYRTDPASDENILLFSDDQAYATIPLGWGSDGSYLAAQVLADGTRTVIALDANGGGIIRSWRLPDIELVRRYELSPDGTRLLLETVQNHALTLVQVDLSGERIQAQAQLAASAYPAALPVSPFRALWAPRSGSVWLYRQPQSGRPAVSAMIGSDTQPAAPHTALRPGEYLLPQAISPDEAWFLWRRYPNNFTSAYLQAAASETVIPLPADQPENWIGFIGWLQPRGAQ